MNEDPKTPSQLEGRQQRAGRRDCRLAWHVRTAVEIVTGMILGIEGLASETPDAACQLTEVVKKVCTGVKGKTATSFRSGSLFDIASRLDLGQLPHRGCIGNSGRGRHRRRGYQPPFYMPSQKVQQHVQMRVRRCRVERCVQFNGQVRQEPDEPREFGIGHAIGRKGSARGRTLSILNGVGSLTEHGPLGA
ncbi:hypothetical protein roselon_03669 [Roseibacterium elongatum DSM 19469]|uniref:Uncharacterized protein n=1 Tax=Roseicyclus elongatus DSM 19469 TaxID=1294273 RepID=W8RX62_9RHOB|nr:hypothetical protein roselon_03669 [Roseibacterium elongatum DSM 19469]